MDERQCIVQMGASRPTRPQRGCRKERCGNQHVLTSACVHRSAECVTESCEKQITRQRTLTLVGTKGQRIAGSAVSLSIAENPTLAWPALIAIFHACGLCVPGAIITSIHMVTLFSWPLTFYRFMLSTSSSVVEITIRGTSASHCRDPLPTHNDKGVMF